MRSSTLRASKALIDLGACQPYVCAHCQISRARRTIHPPPVSRRTFTSSRPSLRPSPQDQTTPSAQRGTPIPRTHYDFFPQTFPHGPPPAAAFSPDLKQLRREFLQLQAKAHPDLAAPSDKKPAEALSMRINEAYNTLQDPLRRAQYLLTKEGIDVEDETAKLEDESLLLEVMEAREAVEEVEEEAELAGLRAENQTRIDESVQVLDEAFAAGQIERAAQEAIKLRYWRNIEESIQGWEKGQGGGILHH